VTLLDVAIFTAFVAIAFAWVLWSELRGAHQTIAYLEGRVEFYRSETHSLQRTLGLRSASGVVIPLRGLRGPKEGA